MSCCEKIHHKDTKNTKNTKNTKRTEFSVRSVLFPILSLFSLCPLCLCGENSSPQRLTTDGKLKIAPVFANRNEIVFATHEIPNLVALKRLKLLDGSQERLH